MRICFSSCRSAALGSIPSSSSAARASRYAVERLRLPARAVEREHQLAAQPLAVRVLRDQRLELADQLGVAAEREVGLDPLLERRQPQILQPPGLDSGKRLLAELRQRRPPPERERLAQTADARAGSPAASASRPRKQSLEPPQVELVGLDLEHVARRLA